jgi:hypothetical protein
MDCNIRTGGIQVADLRNVLKADKAAKKRLDALGVYYFEDSCDINSVSTWWTIKGKYGALLLLVALFHVSCDYRKVTRNRRLDGDV